jgi:hypothetical protein
MLFSLVLLLFQAASTAEAWQVQPVDIVIPSYPPVLARARVEGAVDLVLEIDGAGVVRSVTRVTASPSLDSPFVTLSKEAARGWRFVQSKNDKRELALRVNFHLDETSDPNDPSPLRPARVSPGVVEVYGRCVVIDRRAA